MRARRVELEPTGDREEIVIRPDEAGVRLDRFLVSRREDTSRSMVQQMIHEGWVRVNQRIVKPAYRLRSGDRLTITWARIRPMEELKPIHRPFRVLDEADDYLVILKPPGLVVHPGAGYHEDTLVQRLIARYPEIRSVGHPLRPGIVHRLDRVTAGVMVVARSQRGYLYLVDAFKHRRVKKEYFAICVGIPEPPAGELRTLIGRHPKHRKRFDVVVRNGKPAVTRYRVIGVGKGLSLVRVVIRTGRTHQIRVHMAYRGVPVFADPVYGRTGVKRFDPRLQGIIKALRQKPAIPLVARILAFPDIDSGEYRVYRSPLPRWFHEILKLGEVHPVHPYA